MKTCPYCAEQIQDAAVVCRYCGRDLIASHGAGAVQVVARQKTSPVTWGCTALLVFVGLVTVIGAMLPDRPTQRLPSAPRSRASSARPAPEPSVAPRLKIDVIRFEESSGYFEARDIATTAESEPVRFVKVEGRGVVRQRQWAGGRYGLDLRRCLTAAAGGRRPHLRDSDPRGSGSHQRTDQGAELMLWRGKPAPRKCRSV